MEFVQWAWPCVSITYHFSDFYFYHCILFTFFCKHAKSHCKKKKKIWLRIQLSYDGNWTTLVCANYGIPMEMKLLDNESIVQVSGKYDYGYICELMFVTSQGRSFKVGQPSGISFNFYPTHDGSELRFLSGRHNGWGITSIGAHWAVYHSSDNSVTP
uniref:Jacalin-type lectin domain-containing protein n=1 Tax=Sinocyclocheilus rhinocerous TaxID=307959 RepID=A0A673HCX1_9TELE